METHGPRYNAVITMRRLQVEGLTLEEAADRAAIAHGVGSAETVKSWAKRDDLRSLADKHLSSRDRWQAILKEADRLGIEYGRDWPISRIRAAIAHGVGSAETVKSWAKRDDLRSLADKHLSSRDRWQAILKEADRLGIEYGRDWPISRIRAAIQGAKGKK